MTTAEAYERGRCTADEARALIREDLERLLAQKRQVEEGLRLVYLQLARVAEIEARERAQVVV